MTKSKMYNTNTLLW